MKPSWPNKKEFKLVCDELAGGQELTLAHVGRVFGQPFWEMTVILLLDSQDAARAIQGAISRLREEGNAPSPEDFED